MTYMKLSFVLLTIPIQDLMTVPHLHQCQNLGLEKQYIPNWQSPIKIIIQKHKLHSILNNFILNVHNMA